MSTNSRIYLKLKNEDKNKTMKGDEKLINISNNNFETPSVELNGDYISVYCHWDGYFNGVGKALFKYHNTYNHILNMLLFGYLSYVDEGIMSYHAWRGEDEEPWKCVKPNVTNDTKLSESYNYLFDCDTNKWYVKCEETNNEWEELEQHIS